MSLLSLSLSLSLSLLSNCTSQMFTKQCLAVDDGSQIRGNPVFKEIILVGDRQAEEQCAPVLGSQTSC